MGSARDLRWRTVCCRRRRVAALAVREGAELVFVERIAGHRSVDLLTNVGARFPLAATGMGRVLLADPESA